MSALGQDAAALAALFRTGLFEDTLPFWARHATDLEHGGFLHCLDRDGTVVDTDKALWVHGRYTWLLATLHAEVEPRSDWYALAEHGIRFLERHGFDDEGRMWFTVTRDGRPLRQRRYRFTESFGAIAFAAWARISGEERASVTARRLLDHFVRAHRTPGAIAPKFTGTRPVRALGPPMIQLATAQVLRACLGDDPGLQDVIQDSLHQIGGVFLNEEHRALLEQVGERGEVLDHFDGRTLNPGHALEAAWFVLHEARMRGGDRELVRLGTTIVDWTWERGWDTEHGGLLYFTDLLGKPVQEYWHDMKFWWNHCEAILAALHAYEATGDEAHARRFRTVLDWTLEHFPDPVHGEWFGYLHRDGSRSSSLKGNLWKGPFHIPRMQLVAWQLCERLARQ